MYNSNEKHIPHGQKAYLWECWVINCRSNEAVGFVGSCREFVII